MKFNDHEEKLTAYALGELEALDAAEVETLLEHDEQARRYVEEIRAIGGIAEEAFAAESLGNERHEAILAEVGSDKDNANPIWGSPLGWKRWSALAACAVAVLAGLVGLNAPVAKVKPLVGSLESRLGDFSATDSIAPVESDQLRSVTDNKDEKAAQTFQIRERSGDQIDELMRAGEAELGDQDYDRALELYEKVLVIDPANREATQKLAEATLGAYGEDVSDMTRSLLEPTTFNIIDNNTIDLGVREPEGIVPLRPTIPTDALGVAATDPNDEATRRRELSLEPGQSSNLENVHVGGEIRIRANYFAASDVNDSAANAPAAGRSQATDENAPPPQITRGRAEVPGQYQYGTDYYTQAGQAADGMESETTGLAAGGGGFGGVGGGGGTLGEPKPLVPINQQFSTGFSFNGGSVYSNDELDVQLQIARVDNFAIVPPQLQTAEPNTEAYDRVVDNSFERVTDEPLSTFSIDVDTGSYANVRRFLRNNQLPPKDAVRIEELLNYFQYAYAPPANDDPFAAHVELVECPWNDQHQLMRVGLKGREVEVHTRPAANLVFLLDVSGSMEPANKLPLVRGAMQLLTKQLRPDDRVAIVTYAGASGLVLPSTPGTDQATILSAIGRLNSGGSTNGASGIELAYQVAQEHFFDGGVNRVILATDGDFNVGTTDRGSLERLIEEKAKSGVFLTVLGVGEGNLKDAMMEQLADKGNGQYAYLDSEREARKVLVDQVGGTLVTIAKDVKIQIDFNPAQVGAYRLIGYENRVLAAQDFDDDTKDAGEIGAGHTVTALYEIVPPGVALDVASGTQSRYQVAAAPQVDTHSDELLTVKLRHKQPDGDTSELLEIPIATDVKTLADASQDSRFAAAVAAFGMALRESPYRGSTDWDLIANLAEDGLGNDPHGYRAEFMEMIQIARGLKPAITLTRQTDETGPDDLKLVGMMGDGATAVVFLQLPTGESVRCGVGDLVGSYRVLSIDRSAKEVIVFSEEHRKNVTLSTKDR